VERIQVRVPRGAAVVLVALALLAVIATVAFAGNTTNLSKVAAAPQGTAAVCKLTGPREGLELNIVAVGALFKTVAMEKELFDCGPASGQVTQQRDVETFIELVENTKGQLVERPGILLTSCISDPPTGKISCKNSSLALGAANPTPLKGCRPQSFATPFDPVAMGTAVTNGIVKTIKVDKSWYTCDSPNGPVIRDIYVFNEILERRTTVPGTNTPTVRPFARKTIGIACIKVEARAAITGCHMFPTS
jgi:hypothetical protein